MAPIITFVFQFFFHSAYNVAIKKQKKVMAETPLKKGQHIFAL